LLVSVIIPVCNGGRVIIPCLKSVFDSAGDQSLEMIVIDDCSTDDSLELLKSCGLDIHLLWNDQNFGYAYTVNRGLKECHGDFIFLLNQDAEIETKTISILCEKLLAKPETGMTAPRLLNPDGSLQKSVRRFPNHWDIIFHHLGLPYLFPKSGTFNRWKMGDFDHLEERYVDQPAFSAVMIRHEMMNKVGLLDESFPLFFNDVDYCRRIADSGWKILYCPDAEVRHQKGQATGQHKIRSVYLSHSAFIHYLWKYFRGPKYYLPNFVCALLLVLSANLRAFYYFLKGLISKA